MVFQVITNSTEPDFKSLSRFKKKKKKLRCKELTDITLTDTMYPKEKSRNSAIKLDFLCPKGSVIFDRVRYKILLQLKMYDS